MLDALIAGVRDPAVLADLAKRSMRSKIPELTEALTGRFSEHHAFLVRLHLDLIDQHTKVIDQLTRQIEVAMEPFRSARDLMITIPGISTGVADVIIAETGGDMSRFPSAGHLASWAGCPGQNHASSVEHHRVQREAMRTRCAPCWSRTCLVSGTPAMQFLVRFSPGAERTAP